MAFAVISIALSFALAPKPKKPKNDVSQPRSNYGVPANRIFGTAVVGGNVIDSFRVREQKKGGKGGIGGGKKNAPETFGTFICLIGEGERPWNAYINDGIPNGGRLKLNKIWMNEKLIYSVGDTNLGAAEQNTEWEQYFTFYDGSQDQTQDPTWVSKRSATTVPGLAGYSYIVFNNLPLKDFGGQYPSVKLEMESNLPATPKVIIRDIMARCGIMANRPLIEGRDWAFKFNSQTNDADIPDDISIDGYIISQDGIEMRQVFSDIAQIFRVGIATDPFVEYLLPDSGQSVVAKPCLKILDLQGTDRNVLYDFTGSSNEEYEVPWDFSIEPKPIQEIPASVEVSVADPAKDHERSSVTVRRPTIGASEAVSLSTNATVRDKDTVNSIANYILELGFARGKILTSSMVPNVSIVPPSTAATFQQRVVQRQGGFTGALFSPGTKVQTARTTIGANGVIDFEGFITDTERVDAAIVADTVLDPIGLNPSLCGRTLIFEGPAIAAPITGNRKTLNVLYAPVPGLDTAPPGALFLSTDGGTTYQSTPQTALGVNSEIMEVNSITPGTRPNLNTIDRGTVITVTVNDDTTELESITEAELYDFNSNLVFLPNHGLFTFQTATLIGTGQYELSNILWNVGQSYLDYDNGNTVTGTEAWLLLGQPHETVVSNSIPIGASLTAVITDSGAAVCVPSDPITYRSLNAAPRPPYALNGGVQNNGDIRFNWSRGLSQETSPASIPAWTAADYPNDEIDERYLVYITDGTNVRQIMVADQQFAVYTAADIASDGMVVADIEWGVVQLGAVASIDIENENWRWQPLDNQ